MTLEKYLVNQWFPKKNASTNEGLSADMQRSWYCQEVNKVPFNEYGKVIVGGNTENPRCLRIHDLVIVRVLRGTKVEQQLKKLGFEEIPNDVLQKEIGLC